MINRIGKTAKAVRKEYEKNKGIYKLLIGITLFTAMSLLIFIPLFLGSLLIYLFWR